MRLVEWSCINVSIGQCSPPLGMANRNSYEISVMDFEGIWALQIPSGNEYGGSCARGVITQRRFMLEGGEVWSRSRANFVGKIYISCLHTSQVFTQEADGRQIIQ